MLYDLKLFYHLQKQMLKLFYYIHLDLKIHDKIFNMDFHLIILFTNHILLHIHH